MQKKSGFTLAEVLITLGIIGVVAAMTIPTLITNTQESQYRAAFKKAYAQLANAIKLNSVQNGYDFSNIAETPAGDIDTSVNRTMGNLIARNYEGATDVTNTYFTAQVAGDTITLEKLPGSFKCPNYKYSACTSRALQGAPDLATCQANAMAPNGTKCTTANATINYTYDKEFTTATGGAFQLADGSIIIFDRTGTNCTENEPCYAMLDVNGAKGPNQVTTAIDSIQDIIPVTLMGQRLGLSDELKTLITD